MYTNIFVLYCIVLTFFARGHQVNLRKKKQVCAVAVSLIFMNYQKFYEAQAEQLKHDENSNEFLGQEFCQLYKKKKNGNIKDCRLLKLVPKLESL